jgi:hypothetical protein
MIRSPILKSLPPDALLGLVFSRDEYRSLNAPIQGFGGWDAINLLFPRMAYVVAVAGTPQRMRTCAPMVYGCTHEAELPSIIQMATGALDDVSVHWLVYADDAKRDEILQWLQMDSKVVGHA